MRLNKKTVKKFIWDYWIVGVITNQGQILSICDDFDTILAHGDYYPLVQKRWRWSYQNGLTSVQHHMFDDDDWQFVRDHLTKKYGIPFWDNGYHDIDYFQKLKEKKPKK